MMSLKSFQLLKQFWHDDRYDILKVRVYYIERGSPDDSVSVCGSRLIEPDNKFWFGVVNQNGDIKEIPFHRIYRIEYDGKCLFERLRIPAADIDALNNPKKHYTKKK